MDLAKQQYATLLSGGVALLPLLQFSSSVSNSNQGQSLKEGWALTKTKTKTKSRKPTWRLSIGQSTGRKLGPDEVEKEMRHARGTDGKRFFGVSTFLTPQQLSSFFLAAGNKATSAANWRDATTCSCSRRAHQFLRGKIKCAFHSTHLPPNCSWPVWRMCVGLQQIRIPENEGGDATASLELEVPVPAVKSKAPYGELEELLDSCPCKARKWRANVMQHCYPLLQIYFFL